MCILNLILLMVSVLAVAWASPGLSRVVPADFRRRLGTGHRAQAQGQFFTSMKAYILGVQYTGSSTVGLVPYSMTSTSFLEVVLDISTSVVWVVDPK